MGPIRDAYLLAAASAAELLADPAVGNLWSKPSALESFTVSGLAGHLAGQVLSVPRVLKAPPPQGEVVSLVDHYRRVLWIDADVDAEINVAIRQGGETNASDGAAMLAAQTKAAVEEIRELLAAAVLGQGRGAARRPVGADARRLPDHPNDGDLGALRRSGLQRRD